MNLNDVIKNAFLSLFEDEYRNVLDTTESNNAFRAFVAKYADPTKGNADDELTAIIQDERERAFAEGFKMALRRIAASV